MNNEPASRSKDAIMNTPIPEKTGSYTETRLNSPPRSNKHGERSGKASLCSDNIPGGSVLAKN